MKRTPLRPSTPEQVRAWKRRSKQLEAGPGPERRTPLPASNPERKARLFVRNYNSADYREFVVGCGCVVPGCHGEPIHAAHVHPKAASGTWRSLVGLCPAHHSELDDRLKHRRFSQKYGLDLEALARAYMTRWLELGGGYPEDVPPDPEAA